MIALPVFFFAIYTSDRWRQGFLHGCLLPGFGTDILSSQHSLLAYIKVDPNSVQLEKGFTRDVRNIGHFGTGDLEITIRSDEDFKRAQEYLIKSYEASL